MGLPRSFRFIRSTAWVGKISHYRTFHTSMSDLTCVLPAKDQVSLSDNTWSSSSIAERQIFDSDCVAFIDSLTDGVSEVVIGTFVTPDMA
eukprot:IDg2757t1